MKNIFKGALAVGVCLVASFIIYKKVKHENKDEVINIEDVKQELTQEQQELYEMTVKNVKEQMRPYMRRMKIYRITRFILMFILCNSLSIIAITYDMERMDKTVKEGVCA